MQRDDRWDDEDPETQLESDDPGLDFLGQYAPADDDAPGLSGVGEDRRVVDEDLPPEPDVFFTVSNPSGALAATAALGGRLRHVEVRDVSRLDEARLGEEIVELASLAAAKARAAQHEVTVELMGRRGQDRIGVSAFLEHSIGLPSYETSSTRAAEAFAERYRSNDD